MPTPATPGEASAAARTPVFPTERRGPSEPPRPGSLQAAGGGGVAGPAPSVSSPVRPSRPSAPGAAPHSPV